MKLVRQPEGSNLCGQACVATIAGISLEEAIAVFGKKGSTTTKDVVGALGRLGIPCGDGLIRIKRQLKTPLCMVILHFEGAPRHHGHWTVFRDGLYYDPDAGTGDTYPEGVRETSFLPIYGPKEE